MYFVLHSRPIEVDGENDTAFVMSTYAIYSYFLFIYALIVFIMVQKGTSGSTGPSKGENSIASHNCMNE